MHKKSNLEDFAHNYKKIRIKCPHCVLTNKVSRHCKVFHNLAGLWWHFRREHGQFANRDFDTHDFVEILRKVSKAAIEFALNDYTDFDFGESESSEKEEPEITVTDVPKQKEIPQVKVTRVSYDDGKTWIDVS